MNPNNGSNFECQCQCESVGFRVSSTRFLFFSFLLEMWIYLFLVGVGVAFGEEYPKFTTLIEDIGDSVGVDSQTLAGIVTDIDQHYDNLLVYNQSYGSGGGGGWGEVLEDGGVGWVESGVEQLHPFENSLSVETSGLKLALVLVSLWYLVIASLAGGANLFGPPCTGHPHHAPDEGLVQVIDGNGVREVGEPHPMQGEILKMFQYSDSSEEDDLPMDLVGKLGEMCPQSAFFYGQNSGYMTAAMMLRNMLMTLPSPYAMMEMAMKLRPFVNHKLWFTGLMHACVGRGDMGGMSLPTALDAMPDSFIPDIDKARNHEDECIKVDGTVGKDNGIENKLWYFREDIFVNSHHWYWHLSWPLMTRGGARMDRRGELFYYAHRSFVQRYNIERLCNGLPPAEALDYGAPVIPGYHPHLTDATSGSDWTPRDTLSPLRDIDHSMDKNDPVVIPIRDWLGRLGRVIKAVKSGYWVTPLGKRSIPEKTGIDMLGNTLEAVDISVNPSYYGRDGFHNDGHRILGYIEDPAFEKMLPPGVMSDPATAMRDPIFYRFHTNINDIFEKYKKTLTPYTKSDLSWPGVTLKSIQVVSRSGKVNELKTFWNKRKFGLDMGLAFNRSDHGEEVRVCSKHLDHEEWDYVFDVYRAPCAKSKSNSATFRVFLAPKFDLEGRRLDIHEQRELFVHLDLFNVKVPPGFSKITRSSLASSLTIPPQQSLTQLNSGNPGGQPNCGCGWPHNLLLPKGSKEGSHFDLFVLVTNGDDYLAPPHPTPCSKAFLYCGITNNFYPDSRPMGFPFDRPIGSLDGCGGGVWGKICKLFSGGGSGRRIRFVEEFLGGVGNAGVVPVVVRNGKKK